MSPADVLKEFERYLKAHDRAAKTVKDYLTDLRLFVEWFTHTRDEQFTVSAITPTDIRDYRAYLLHTKHQSPATINRRLTVLRVFFRWAINRGLIAAAPPHERDQARQAGIVCAALARPQRATRVTAGCRKRRRRAQPCAHCADVEHRTTRVRGSGFDAG